MARLLVYDAYENKVYTYSSLRENDPMPYSTGRTLTVREFRGKSNSPVLWTTIAAMEAWNLTRRKYGRGIPVGYAFRRIWEEATAPQPALCRRGLRRGAEPQPDPAHRHLQRRPLHRSVGLCRASEPDPTWVHFDRRYGTPACRGTTAGYPTLRRGSRGCYVMILKTPSRRWATRPGTASTASSAAGRKKHSRATSGAPVCASTASAAATAGRRSPPPCWALDEPRRLLTDFIYYIIVV